MNSQYTNTDGRDWSRGMEMGMAEKNETPMGSPYVTVDASNIDNPARGEWEVGLCSCFHHCVPNCLMACCCPCVSTSQIAARLGVMDYFTALIISILLEAFFPVIGFAILTCSLRKTTRERFEISGNGCSDCCASCWCNPCVIAQMATHTKSYKPGNCDFGPVDTLPAYA